MGLYTEAEENDFDHLQGLAGYTDQVTKKVDNSCALKSLPGAPAYNLAYLEESVENMANLNSWDYFMRVARTPIYTVYKDIGSAGGWIIIIQWLIWLIQVLRKAWRALRGKGINRAHQDPEGFKAEALALAELMGPGPNRNPEVKKSKKKQQIRYTKGDGNVHKL